MRRSEAPAAGPRRCVQGNRWQQLAPRLLLDVAPRNPPARMRVRLLKRLPARG